MKLFSRAAVLAAITAGAIACTVTSTNSGTSSGGSTGGATSDQVTRCKSGCDKMKFFQCSSAAELSKCYSDCDSAGPKPIEVFISCAENSICDPACRTNIAPPPASGGTSTSSSGGGGVPASSCQTACTKLITTCNLAPVGQMQACVDACTKNGYQYQIDCVANNACADIQARCGGSTGGGSSTSSTGGTSGTTSGGTSGGSTTSSSGGTDVGLFRCQSDCDSLLSRQCIDATQQSACRAKCALGTSPARDTFMGCAEAAVDCTAGTGCATVFTQ
jgi:hypothetical protein